VPPAPPPAETRDEETKPPVRAPAALTLLGLQRGPYEIRFVAVN